MTNILDTIIIGSGPAAYTAALYTSRGNLSTLMIAGNTPGGQLMITTEVENYPGFPNGINGPDLMKNMENQARKFGTSIINTNAVKVNLKSYPLEVTTSDSTYYSKTCIIATGAQAKWLNIESETKFIGKGISACATCDGYFFKDKNVIVIGGGDTAIEEALFLTNFVKSIKILVRRDILRASAIMVERARSNKIIEFLFNTEIVQFHGEDRLNSVEIINNKTKEKSHLLIEGAFIAIGHKPNTEIFKDQLELDDLGYIVRKTGSQTSLSTVFVSGDVHDRKYRQAITAAGYGCEAALDVIRFLNEG